MSESIARFIDHTLLRPDATIKEVEKLCVEALEYKFCAVCVNGIYVPFCAKYLQGSEVKVCAPVGFPLGVVPTEVKVFETQTYLEGGAREIDMVMNVGAFLSGKENLVQKEIENLTELCHSQGVILKVILETCLLKTEAQKVRACEIARDAWADYVKTSTGFGSGGATVEDVSLMRGVVGDRLGVKASGGVRDYQMAMAMLSAGATRIGSSAGVGIVSEERGRIS